MSTVSMSAFAAHLWQTSLALPGADLANGLQHCVRTEQRALSVLPAVDHMLKVAGTYSSGSLRNFSTLYF